jgi:hypothetical protein
MIIQLVHTRVVAIDLLSRGFEHAPAKAGINGSLKSRRT